MRGHPSWNSGLTKADSPILARIGALNSKRNKGVVRSEEDRRHQREVKIAHMLDGTFNPGPGYGRGEHITTQKGGSFFARSSWEVVFARMLDGNPEVVRFVHEGLKVTYYWQGVERLTIPDFRVWYVSGLVALVEVKPESRVRRFPFEEAKLRGLEEFARERGWEFRWWNGGSFVELDSFFT